MKKTTVYRRPMDENLFEEKLTIEALSAMGNPLEQLSALVDFEMFRPELEDILVKKDCKSTNTSRSLLPLWDSRVLTSNNQVK